MKIEVKAAKETAPAGGRPGGNTLQHRLTAAFAGALVVVIALALAVFYAAQEALEAGHSVAHTQEVLRALNRVDAATAQAESAVRGFVITGDVVYLGDRDGALSVLESRAQWLRDLTADNDSQQQRWRILRDRLDQRLALLDRLALLRQTEGADAARRFLKTFPPSVVMRSIRDMLEEMRQEEERLLAERARQEEWRRSIAVTTGLVLAVLFVLLFTLVYLAIRRQIAQTVKLNAGLSSRTEEVETANRELEGFSYSVSHDLRAPLRAIDGFSRILTEDYEAQLDAEGKRLLGVIRENSQRMGRLIDDLLDFARLGKRALACSEIDMTALAGKVYRELRAADPHGEAEFGLAPLPQGWGDSAMLRQVLANLLSNALKYVRKERAPCIQVSGWADGNHNVYCVKDDGVGFDMAYYDKLFGVFQRLHSEREFPGTGVGLAIVQRVVLRHGGRVWAESKLDGGAAFYFSLPRAVGDSFAFRPAATGDLK